MLLLDQQEEEALLQQHQQVQQALQDLQLQGGRAAWEDEHTTNSYPIARTFPNVTRFIK